MVAYGSAASFHHCDRPGRFQCGVISRGGYSQPPGAGIGLLFMLPLLISELLRKRGLKCRVGNDAQITGLARPTPSVEP